MFQKIEIDLQNLKKISSELGSRDEQFRKILDLINEAEEEVRNSWRSDFTEDYIECLESTKKKIENAMRSISKVSTALDTTAKNIINTEQNLNNMLRH